MVPLSHAPPSHALSLSLWLFLSSPGSQEDYVRSLVAELARPQPGDAAKAAPFRCVVFNARGCADAPLRSPRLYSAAATDDLRRVLDHVAATLGAAAAAARMPAPYLLAAGFSLGANVLVKYLGEEGDGPPGAPPAPARPQLLLGAASVGNPWDLPLCMQALHERPFYRLTYAARLGNNLKRTFRKCVRPCMQADCNVAHVTGRTVDDTGTKPCWPWRPRSASTASTICSMYVEPSKSVCTLSRPASALLSLSHSLARTRTNTHMYMHTSCAQVPHTYPRSTACVLGWVGGWVRPRQWPSLMSDLRGGRLGTVRLARSVCILYGSVDCLYVCMYACANVCLCL
jgi:hypothetical protein